MKLVKEYMNEKFTSKSDPIEDMGIGIGALDVYKEVWTIIKQGDTEIYNVYVKKEYAERAAEKRYKEEYDYHRQVNKRMTDEEFNRYFNDKSTPFGKSKVETLANAIDMIKDAIRDDYQESEYYRQD